MKNAVMTLFVPFSPPGDPWIVRRARTVVEVCPTREQAMTVAFDRAAELAQRMGMRVRVQAQDENGQWRALPPASDIH